MTDNTERNAEIIRRIRAGEFPHQIAPSMGVTRNVVIGVCNRAGLSDQSGLRHHQALRRGERHPSAKLTAYQASEIRRRYWSGETGRKLAAEFGVSDRAVRDIAHERSWFA